MLRSVLILLLTANLAVAQTAPASTQQPTTLHMDVQLVTVDVVVTDKNGRPVHGLSKADFTVQENKSAQVLNGFEEHTGSNAAATAATGTTPVGVFENTPQTRGGAVDVLLIDALNTPPTSQPYLRDQLVKFLAAEKPGRQTAVFLLNTRLAMLQDFTTDPQILKRVVKLQGVKFSPLLNRELNDSAVHSQSETLSDMAAANPAIAPTLLQIQSTLLDMDARQQSQQTQLRARTTMDALQQLSRFLAGVPGRKNLMWFSGSFPVFIQRDIQTTGDVFAGRADLSNELTRTIDILAQNQLAIYPIDSRGVDVPPSQLPTEDGFTGDLQRTRQVYGTRSATPRDDQFWTDQANEHSTMNELAAGTGGRAFYNTNAITAAIDQATTDGENYYTLQYTPPPGSKPGEFRNLSVTVNKPGLKLAYRKGYYAAAKTVHTPESLSKTLSNAMGADTADSSEIALQVAPAAAPETEPSKVIGLKVAGDAPHAQYIMNMSVDVKGLYFAEGADGKMHGTLLFATVLYAKNGKVIDSRQDRAVLALDVERYKAMLAQGLRYHSVIALPNASDATVRVAVQDADTGRVGSMHLRADQVQFAANAKQQ